MLSTSHAGEPSHASASLWTASASLKSEFVIWLARLVKGYGGRLVNLQPQALNNAAANFRKNETKGDIVVQCGGGQFRAWRTVATVIHSRQHAVPSNFARRWEKDRRRTYTSRPQRLMHGHVPHYMYHADLNLHGSEDVLARPFHFWWRGVPRFCPSVRKRYSTRRDEVTCAFSYTDIYIHTSRSMYLKKIVGGIDKAGGLVPQAFEVFQAVYGRAEVGRLPHRQQDHLAQTERRRPRG